MATSLKNKKQIDCEDDFTEVANDILNNSVLNIKGKKFRILEVEFYLFKDDFQDYYTHRDSIQLEYGKIYFHKINGRSYKSGTFKCMDFVFGDKKINKYCGMLIRAMLDLEKNEAIVGPCKCVEKLLSEFSCNNVKELENKKEFLIDLRKDSDIKLRTKTFDKEELYIGPRIGLGDKYPNWKDKLYRFVIMKQYVKKENFCQIQIKNYFFYFLLYL